MGISKNHHYIPQSILKQFCFSGSSLLLFDASAPEKGYRQRNIGRAFQKFHANTIEFDSGHTSDHVEKWLADNVDGPIGNVINIAERDQRILLEPETKRIAARYLIALLLRAPRGRGQFVDDADPIALAMELVFKIARTFGFERDMDIFGNGTPTDMRSAIPIILPTLIGDAHVDAFMEFEFVVAQPAGSQVFCLGDFPVMRYDDPRNSLDDVMHEYWFILGPRMAACFLAKTTLEIGGKMFAIPNSYVRKINFDFAMRSQFVAANCPVALHETIRNLGKFPDERSLAETKIQMFEPCGEFYD